VILGWVRKFKDTSNVTDIAHGATRTVRTEENVQRVRESFVHVALHPRHIQEGLWANLAEYQVSLIQDTDNPAAFSW
jgi:hypothetical protein